MSVAVCQWGNSSGPGASVGSVREVVGDGWVSGLRPTKSSGCDELAAGRDGTASAAASQGWEWSQGWEGSQGEGEAGVGVVKGG